MNALEELRKYARSTFFENTDFKTGKMIVGRSGDDELEAIADRIEAEYMELPRDKNGKVIHVGDTITYFRRDNATNIVIAIMDNHEVLLGGYCYVNASDIELVEPDSMERIKADAKKDYDEYWGCEANCKPCASSIKYPGIRDCEVAQKLDLISRTEKVLGGEQK